MNEQNHATNAARTQTSIIPKSQPKVFHTIVGNLLMAQEIEKSCHMAFLFGILWKLRAMFLYFALEDKFNRLQGSLNRMRADNLDIS